MTNRMTAGEAFYRSSYELDPRPISWESLSSETKRSWETGAKEVLSDAAAIRGRMGEGWQTFDSAPQDRECILAFSPDAGWFEAVWRPRVCDDGGWFSTHGEDLNDDLPTHWMRPEPPQCQT